MTEALRSVDPSTNPQLSERAPISAEITTDALTVRGRLPSELTMDCVVVRSDYVRASGVRRSSPPLLLTGHAVRFSRHRSRAKLTGNQQLNYGVLKGMAVTLFTAA